MNPVWKEYRKLDALELKLLLHHILRLEKKKIIFLFLEKSERSTGTFFVWPNQQLYKGVLTNK